MRCGRTVIGDRRLFQDTVLHPHDADPHPAEEKLKATARYQAHPATCAYLWVLGSRAPHLRDVHSNLSDPMKAQFTDSPFPDAALGATGRGVVAAMLEEGPTPRGPGAARRGAVGGRGRGEPAS